LDYQVTIPNGKPSHEHYSGHFTLCRAQLPLIWLCVVQLQSSRCYWGNSHI